MVDVYLIHGTVVVCLACAGPYAWRSKPLGYLEFSVGTLPEWVAPRLPEVSNGPTENTYREVVA